MGAYALNVCNMLIAQVGRVCTPDCSTAIVHCPATLASMASPHDMPTCASHLHPPSAMQSLIALSALPTHLQDCSAVVDSCDISSSTGTGIGSEGGSPQMYRCTVHNCERNGVAVFGGLDGSRASAVLENCELAWNKGHGLLVRDGATPSVSDSEIFRNGGYGLMLQDCGGSYSRNTVVENGAGAVGYQLVFEVRRAALGMRTCWQVPLRC